MNTLPEDVIVDLLPPYFSGDASAATRAIVDAYFEAHPEFAATMRAAMAGDALVPGLPADSRGTRAIVTVRKQLKWRAALMAAAIFFSVMPFTFIASGGHLVYFMWRDAPLSAGVCAVTAALAWGALWITVRRADKP